jgi:hypothetical protein
MPPPNLSLHPTAIPLHFIAAGEFGLCASYSFVNLRLSFIFFRMGGGFSPEWKETFFSASEITKPTEKLKKKAFMS